MKFAGGARDSRLDAARVNDQGDGNRGGHGQAIPGRQALPSLLDASTCIDSITSTRGNLLPVLDLRLGLALGLSGSSYPLLDRGAGADVDVWMAMLAGVR